MYDVPFSIVRESNLLPVPRYRDSREGGILSFISYQYADISEQTSGTFNPNDSPVQIAFGSLNTVVFSLTNSVTSEPVEGAVVQVDGVSLAAGSYNYTVTKHGYVGVESTAFTSSETTMTIDVVLEFIVGVEQEAGNSFSFYPNPASEVVTLRFAEPYSGKIELYSMMGSLVKQFKFENELSGNIFVSDLESGMYILRAGAHSERLIVK